VDGIHRQTAAAVGLYGGKQAAGAGGHGGLLLGER
jgi:hypothetical protein